MIWDFENEKLCEKHDATISGLREEIDNMCAKYTDLSTDADLNFVVDSVREECEINKQNVVENIKTEYEAIIENLQMERETEVRNLHIPIL